MGLRFVSGWFFVVILLSGCVLKLNANTDLQNKSSRTLVVTTTNYQTGALALFDLDARLSRLNFAPIFSDAIVKSFPQVADIFVINRLGADNIQKIDRTTGATLLQFSVGIGSNPQDMVVLGRNAYISRLEEARILKVDIETGLTLREIDLTPFADDDGSPEPARMALNGDELWIQLQRLNRINDFAPVNTAQIVIIDTKKDEVLRVVQLTGRNPVTGFKPLSPFRWLVADAGFVGSRSQLDGGVELLDLNMKKSIGFITTEAQLGGDLVDFECLNQKQCLAIISKPHTELVVFDPETGVKLRSLWTSSGYHLRQILREERRGLVYVADGNPYEPKIRVWSEVELIQQTAQNWSLSLPPYQMEFLY